MALIKCPECGKEISDTAESCIHCGYPLTDDNSKQDEPFCTSCGNPLKPGSKFCGKCGTPRDWDIRSAQESQHSQSPGVSVLGAQEFNTPSGRKFKSRFTALGILAISVASAAPEIPILNTIRKTGSIIRLSDTPRRLRSIGRTVSPCDCFTDVYRLIIKRNGRSSTTILKYEILN